MLHNAAERSRESFVNHVCFPPAPGPDCSTCRRHWLKWTAEAEWILETYLFFFFQAEDGIRDSSVTGVQTCALPISPPIEYDLPIPTKKRQEKLAGQAIPTRRKKKPKKKRKKTVARQMKLFSAEEDRSEERRGGEECRSRWAPDH